MKHFCAVLFMTTCFSTVIAQPNYFRTGATWAYHTEERPEFPGAVYRDWITQLTLGGDTLIQSRSYKKLHSHTKYSVFDPQVPGGPVISYYDLDDQYFRYDSSSSRVFVYKDIQATENLLYDFNLIAGDSVPGLDHFYIDSIETISLFGNPARKFSLIPDSGMSLVSPAYILEGIGSSIGLVELDPYMMSISSETYTNLVCFQLGNDVYPSGSSCDAFAGLSNRNLYKPVFKLYPNPVKELLCFSSRQDVDNLEISIYNIQSQKVISYSIQKVGIDVSTCIPVSALENGIYFVSILTDEGSELKKIIIQ
jgi:hypothetical protein